MAAQEDTCGAAHFGTILDSAADRLDRGEALSAGGLIPALVAGYEAGGVIEKALSGTDHAGRFRSSAIYGTIAASAAAGMLMELSRPDGGRAGQRGVILRWRCCVFADGTDEWRYQVGVVARNGLVAAELARAGSVSAPHAFEGKSGFARAFAKADLDGGLAASLGRDGRFCAWRSSPIPSAPSTRRQ